MTNIITNTKVTYTKKIPFFKSETNDFTKTVIDTIVNNSDYDKSDSDNELLEHFSLTDNSELFVVSVDDYPKFYVKDIKTARERMCSIARQLVMKKFTNGYRTNFINISENELHIVGSYRFFLIAYDTVLNRITCSKIEECV